MIVKLLETMKKKLSKKNVCIYIYFEIYISM
jgi:hypothetical protein